MLLRDFVHQMDAKTPQLSATLTVKDFVRFASLTAKVQQVAGESLRPTPAQTTAVMPFLISALLTQIPEHLMGELWRLAFTHLPGCDIDTSAALRLCGLSPDLTNKLPEQFLRAPLLICICCPEASALHIHSRLDGYLYDTDGTHAVQTVILCCSNPTCGTFYRPSYYTKDGFQIYYSQAMGREPNYLHIHCHFYMTCRLAYMFQVIQMLAHVSHFNLVNWYNQIFVEDTPIAHFDPNQKFTPSMSEEVCRDGLIIHSLMNHANRRGIHQAVTSTGNDSIRFDSAIQDHLGRLSAEGTLYCDHFCSSCVRITSQTDPETGETFYKSIRAVVTDGLTIGHYWCSASSEQLQDIAKRFGLPAPEGPCTNHLNSIND
ncbi:uncharacterized protein MELLADRAFT_89839 [Melampsora larici-populina 98AG31]|uniref:CxC5 like cysteine cluster associated with KDZ domain-containing protein n=1 Tax=Melampsora larici-populina (strain 98AG31 / pathotype 3-4-7) TaxID=747676 RepID=F4RUT6_MELLP|nr:uncharacterized protein MELLADRAFT_89839 [Melampsora larici-populina 98AG31]EGG03754.1 hypothetical protein MELLADRAFT_89839 [Melampsora larici-populina 98AG31]